MNETIETTLLLNLFFFENGEYQKNEEFIQSKRRKAISLLEEDAEELQLIDANLAQEYTDTISYLESISDEEYQNIKKEIIESVSRI